MFVRVKREDGWGQERGTFWGKHWADLGVALSWPSSPLLIPFLQDQEPETSTLQAGDSWSPLVSKVDLRPVAPEGPVGRVLPDCAPPFVKDKWHEKENRAFPRCSTLEHQTHAGSDFLRTSKNSPKSPVRRQAFGHPPHRGKTWLVSMSQRSREGGHMLDGSWKLSFSFPASESQHQKPEKRRKRQVCERRPHPTPQRSCCPPQVWREATLSQMWDWNIKEGRQSHSWHQFILTERKWLQCDRIGPKEL